MRVIRVYINDTCKALERTENYKEAGKKIPHYTTLREIFAFGCVFSQVFL